MLAMSKLFPKTIKIYIVKHYLNKGVAFFFQIWKEIMPKNKSLVFGIQIFFKARYVKVKVNSSALISRRRIEEF
jgi:hypothetical protein